MTTNHSDNTTRTEPDHPLAYAVTPADSNKPGFVIITEAQNLRNRAFIGYDDDITAYELMVGSTEVNEWSHIGYYKTLNMAQEKMLTAMGWFGIELDQRPFADAFS